MTKQNIPVFSVRAKADDIEDWKLYAQAADISITSLVTQAMKDYVESHPLKGLKLQRYEELKNEQEEKKYAKVRAWVEDTAARIINGTIKSHAEKWYPELSEEEIEEGTAPYIEGLVDTIMEDWTGTDDPLDDENEHERNLTEKFLEEQAEKVSEDFFEKYDEWKEEQEERAEFEDE